MSRCTTAAELQWRRPRKANNKNKIIQAGESPKPSSGDCVNRQARFHHTMKARSIIRWQHRLKRERPTCTERMNRSPRVRMEAWRQWQTRQEKKPCPTKTITNPLDFHRPSHGSDYTKIPLGRHASEGILV